jgi:hypothetical protein
MKYYAAIGGDNAPIEILLLLSKLSNIFEQQGFCLRTSADTGVPQALIDGVSDKNNNTELFVVHENTPLRSSAAKANYLVPKETSPDAYFNINKSMGKPTITPHWEQLTSRQSRDRYTCAAFNLLGQNLKSPCLFLLIYKTEDDKQWTEVDTGIQIANRCQIPVFNLATANEHERLKQFTETQRHLMDNQRIANIYPNSAHNPHQMCYFEFFPPTPPRDKKQFKRKFTQKKEA